MARKKKQKVLEVIEEPVIEDPVIEEPIIDQLSGCMYCGLTGLNHCVCTDENRPVDRDQLRLKLMYMREVAEKNLSVNSFMFQHETDRIRSIDRHLEKL